MHATVQLGCALLVAAALVACPKRDGATSKIPDLIDLADERWEQRDVYGLDGVEEVLLEAWQEDAAHPEVLWRMARLGVSRGLLDPDPRSARYALAEARSLGMQCLDGDPVFQQRRLEVDWAEAIEVLPARRLGCAAWGGMAWTRWLSKHGAAAAALDIARLELMLDAVITEGSYEERSVGVWARGILEAARPEWSGGDPAEARALLERAVRLDARSLVRRLDLYRLSTVPSGDGAAAAAERTALLERRARYPEDAWARRQLDGGE